MTTDDGIELLVYVFSYPTDLASSEQFEAFREWLGGAGIDDWVFSGRAETRDEYGPLWFIAVVDGTGGRTLNEFAWTGELQDIDEEEALEIVRRAKPSISDRVSYGGTIPPPVKRPDGTWVVPSGEA